MLRCDKLTTVQLYSAQRREGRELQTSRGCLPAHQLDQGTPMDSTIEHLTDAAFADTVSEGLTVIDFWAAWCGPCRAMAPQFERAAALRPQYRFAKVDVDAEPRLAGRYAIPSIPPLMVLRDRHPLAPT